MSKLWSLNGKIIVDSNGKPILCDHCPCVSISSISSSSSSISSISSSSSSSSICTAYQPPSEVTVTTYYIDALNDEITECTWGAAIKSFAFKLASKPSITPDSRCYVTADYKYTCKYSDTPSILTFTFTAEGELYDYAIGEDPCDIGSITWTFPDAITNDYTLCDIYRAPNVTACKLS